MHFDLVNWSGEYRNDGIAYINQRIEEMLSHFADHVFSVPVCNTSILLKEYLNTASQVKNGNIKQEHLEPIMNEFWDAFKNDLVIKKHIDERFTQELFDRINQATLDDRFRLMRFLYNKLSDYNLWCKNDLRELVLQEKEKKKIEKVLKSYISGLIDGGYSRKYIYFHNREVFNNLPVCSDSSLDAFFNRFDFESRKYTVYIAIDEELAKYKSVLEKRLGAIFDCEKEASGIKKAPNFVIAKFQLDALDYVGAANKAYESLRLFTEFYKFITDKKTKWINSYTKVVAEDGITNFERTRDEEFSFSRRIDTIDKGIIVENMVSTLVFEVPRVFPILQRIVDLHNTSIDRSNINNAFLNLWSVLEILLVYEHTESKINELGRKLIPILQQNYIQLVFDKLREDIIDNIPSDSMIPELKNVDLDMNPDILPSIILMSQYEDARNKLVDLLDDFPLIRSRILQYNELYSNKKKVLADIDRFTQRVHWHIHRLYRARNAIVHSGSNPSNIKELSRHLHNYVDEAVMEILHWLIFDESISSIDDAVIEIQLRIDLLKKRLSSKDPLDNIDLISLFVPPLMQSDYLHVDDSSSNNPIAAEEAD